MTDVVDIQTRSRMMAEIRSSNTTPEVTAGSALHRRGFRFARSACGLPMRPDIVITHWNAAVFVNGCFWHMHGCNLSKIPATNQEFWIHKLLAKKARDERSILALALSGWRVLFVWECAVRGKAASDNFNQKFNPVADWIRGQRDMSFCDVSNSGVVYKKGLNESN